MNRLLLSASRSAAASFRNGHAGTPSSAVRFVAARHFSDAADGAADGGDSADETKIGTVKFFQGRGQFGFIIPDGVDMKNHESKDTFFVHTNEIKTVEVEKGRKFYPSLRRGMRVQFKAGPPKEGSAAGNAYDVTLEDGSLVPAFQPSYLPKYIEKQKALLGGKVLEIFDTSTDSKELEEKLVQAYEEAKGNIDSKKKEVEVGEVMTGTKGEKEQ